MTNKDDSGGLVIALAISWGFLFVFWLICQVALPIGKREKIIEPREADLIFLKDLEKVQEPNPLVCLFGEALAFPRFYTLVFGALPALIVIFSKKLLEDEVEEAFFFHSSDDQDLKVEQIILWLAVYCFCGSMFSVLLSCLLAIPTSYENDALFERFPLQYSDKMFTQFAVLGSFLLLVAIVSAWIKVDADLIEDDLINLLRSGVCAPWALLVKIEYEALLRIFAESGIIILPVFKVTMHVGSVAVSILVLFFISKTNEIAMYCFMGIATAFVGIPNLFWILSSSKIQIGTVEKKEDTTERQFQPSVTTLMLPFKCSIVSKPSQIGLKHSVWTPWKPWLLSFSGFFFRVPTESDTTATLVSFVTVFEEMNTCLFLLLLPLSPPCVCCIWIRELIAEIRQRESLSTALLSPPMGRSVLHLLYDYTECVYFVDAHGIVPALAYFNRYAEKVAEQRIFTQKAFFVFNCSSPLDFWMLVHGMENILTKYRISLGAEKLDFMIISSTKYLSDINSENGQFMQARRLIHNRLITEAKSFCYIDLAKLCSIDGADETALISIGSPALSNLSRWIVKSSVETRNVKVFDVIFEKPNYRVIDGINL